MMGIAGAQSAIDRTPLQNASWEGNLDSVLELLNEENEVNAATNEEGWTALHIATAFGHEEVVMALLNATDIEVNSVDSEGMTPLHYASRDGRLDLVGNKIPFSIVHNYKHVCPLLPPISHMLYCVLPISFC